MGRGKEHFQAVVSLNSSNFGFKHVDDRFKFRYGAHGILSPAATRFVLSAASGVLRGRCVYLHRTPPVVAVLLVAVQVDVLAKATVLKNCLC